MHTNEKGTFAAEVAGAAAPFKTNAPALAAHLQEVDEKRAAFSKTLEKLSTVDLSSLMEIDDDQRDRGINNLCDYAQVCALRKNEKWAQAGQLVVNTIRKVGWNMDLLSYADETNRVDTLLNMLKNEPELKLAIETMQAQDWVTEIEEGQTSFKRHSAERVDKEAVQEAKNNSKQAANALGDAVAKLFRFIESEIEFYNKAELKELVVKFNTIIDKYVSLQKQRATRAKNEKKDPKK
jgi:hypothetical protein